MRSLSSLKAIASRRQVSVLLLGISSGLPLLLIGGTLQAWMTDQKISLATIGLMSWVGLPYTIKFLWAPLLDRWELPLFGRRRGWILLTQLILAGLIAAFSTIQPSQSLFSVALIAFLISFFSATQDIAIDSYRREILSDTELGLGSSLAVTGYRIGMLLAGSGALIMADQIPWSDVYMILACIQLAFTIVTFFAPKEPRQAAPRTLTEAVILPLKDYFSRPEAWTLLSFILLYKLGDQLAASMTTPFYLDLGFTKTEIGKLVKTFGLGSILLGGIVGGVWMMKMGLRRSLWVFGILQALFTLILCVLVIPGQPVGWLLIAVIATENFTYGLGGAAFSALMAQMTNRKFTATQFALLSSLTGIPRVILSSPTGFLAQHLGWIGFFIFCTLTAIPGLWMCRNLKFLKQIESE